ncbi:MAG: hypothetical protein RL341_2561 [Pseudomonadota bacterium]|jgi:uncharacterized membrane protein
MKKQDIDVLLAEQLISTQQHSAIVARFGLTDTRGKLGGIIGMIGAVLVAAGVALLISANWDAIPRLAKVAGVIALLIGAHAGGLWLAARDYAKLGSALHVMGSVLFLLAIALIGQVYNISSRPPNAFLLWAVGIAALPWLLKSRAQYLLWMAAVTVWLVAEAAQAGSLLYLRSFDGFAVMLAVFALLWLAVSLAQCRLPAHHSTEHFALDGERASTALMNLSLLALVAGLHGFGRSADPLPLAWWAIGGVCLAAAFALLLMDTRLSPAAKRIWAIAWAVAALCAAFATVPFEWRQAALEHRTWLAKDRYAWVAALVLLAFCLAQIQVGLARGSAALINLGVAFTALNIAVVYLRLFGSMMQTGLMFVITGVALVALAFALERARRKLMAQLSAGANHG